MHETGSQSKWLRIDIPDHPWSEIFAIVRVKKDSRQMQCKSVVSFCIHVSIWCEVQQGGLLFTVRTCQSPNFFTFTSEKSVFSNSNFTNVSFKHEYQKDVCTFAISAREGEKSLHFSAVQEKSTPWPPNEEACPRNGLDPPIDWYISG